MSQRSNALRVFGDVVEDEEVEEEGHYKIEIKNPKHYYVVVGLLGDAAVSFRQCVTICQLVRQTADAVSVLATNEAKVAKIARCACAMNFAKIIEVLCQCWTFSVALDMSNHQETGYFAIRIRLFHNSTLYNIHLCALPIVGRHTALNLFTHFVKLIEILCPNWKQTMLSVGSDGEAKVTGCCH